MLRNVRAKAVLDLGCGEGGYSRELARRGAIVTAVDCSARLVDVASQRALAENLEVRYLCNNANRLEGIATESVDLVLASMSLMDVEDYLGSIRESYRVLSSGCVLLMSIT